MKGKKETEKEEREMRRMKKRDPQHEELHRYRALYECLVAWDGTQHTELSTAMHAV